MTRNRAHTTSSLLVMMLLLMVGGAVVGRPASAQDTTTMSATLLRRLAEAVDGQRNGQQVWVVIQRLFPHDVRGVYNTQPLAAGVAANSPGYLALGPFIALPDSGTQVVMYTIDPCPGKHDSFSQCPDTTRSNGAAFAAIAQRDVDSLVVTIYGKRTAIHRTYAANEVDALFFTLPAIDKFVMPYYTRLYGPDIAAQMRRGYLRQVQRAAQR